ncbi:MAG TPA: sulfur carrier protein ThiS [Syntrophorhabdaceae bacterium]|nr:sulfur carrier protein ThiS [Syntrophorhabdaceae bacterium]MDI9559767.1 sulfur carrier protein ThiS [Pseudomonadota bacterium]HOS59276.1 sulfur carrier protein ThiS [Syntrophorhabdaceae bacterium]HPH42113.1 sulfur carrier protein ThiS [Syntrophorhabdaceae bacterium]HQG51148.1 sulfur carrier protein ThiS [Syntrophorhabdaceae bacterium]
MKIIVDGIETEMLEGTTVSRLLEILEEPLKSDLIIEINKRFVHAKDYSNRVLKGGDSVEIIHLDIGG